MFDSTSGQKSPETIVAKWSNNPVEYVGYRNGYNEALPQEPGFGWIDACVANAALKKELAAQAEVLSSLYGERLSVRPGMADKLWKDRLLPDQGCLATLYADA